MVTVTTKSLKWHGFLQLWRWIYFVRFKWSSGRHNSQQWEKEMGSRLDFHQLIALSLSLSPCSRPFACVMQVWDAVWSSWFLFVGGLYYTYYNLYWLMCLLWSKMMVAHPISPITIINQALIYSWATLHGNRMVQEWIFQRGDGLPSPNTLPPPPPPPPLQ